MSLSNYLGASQPGQNFDARLHPNVILHRWFPLLDEFFGYKFLEDKERSANNTTISTEHGFYAIKLNVSPFSSKEIKVKAIGRSTISIEGSYKGKRLKDDEEVSEYLFKKFVIPEGYDVKKAKCEISADEKILTIIIPPKMNVDEHEIIVKKVSAKKSKKKLVSKL